MKSPPERRARLRVRENSPIDMIASASPMTGRDQLDPFGDDRRSAWAWVELSNLMRLDAAIRLWIDQIKDLRSGGDGSRAPEAVHAALST